MADREYKIVPYSKNVPLAVRRHYNENENTLTPTKTTPSLPFIRKLGETKRIGQPKAGKWTLNLSFLFSVFLLFWVRPERDANCHGMENAPAALLPDV
ncbi:hypothetical protein ACLOJK_024538 [Asimina triloba]